MTREDIQFIAERRKAEADVFRFLEEVDHLFDKRSIGERIKAYFEENGYSSAEVFAKGGLDRSYGYDILSGRTQNPGRDKMIMLTIGMGLNLDDAQAFLAEMDYATLNPVNKRDCIIMYGLEHSLEIRAINEVLYAEELAELK